MFDWLRRRTPLNGFVLFRGAMPPTAEGFGHLAARGLTVTPAPAGPDERWRLTLAHPDWGSAALYCPRDFLPPPPSLIETSWLSAAEKAEFLSGGSAAFVEMAAAGDNLLRERKLLLRFLDAAAGPDGVGVYDLAAWRLWSRAGLADELAHDGDLDVMGLMTLHAVPREPDGEEVWIHSHGLGEIGLVDFDLVQPAPGLTFDWNIEVEQALAAAILEGLAGAGSGPFDLAQPGDPCRLVHVARFLATGAGHGADLLREKIAPDDEDHLGSRVVICEAGGGGLLGGLLPARRPRALAFPWADGDDDGEERMIYLSAETTELMAARARATFDLLRQMADEFAEFEVTVLAKLGYETDHGDADDREHLWFGVHGMDLGVLDATLLSHPVDIAAMNSGDRDRHPSDRLTDWIIFTPIGEITPHAFTVARMIRDDPDAVRAAMRAAEEGVEAE